MSDKITITDQLGIKYLVVTKEEFEMNERLHRNDVPHRGYYGYMDKDKFIPSQYCRNRSFTIVKEITHEQEKKSHGILVGVKDDILTIVFDGKHEKAELTIGAEDVPKLANVLQSLLSERGIYSNLIFKPK